VNSKRFPYYEQFAVPSKKKQKRFYPEIHSFSGIFYTLVFSYRMLSCSSGLPTRVVCVNFQRNSLRSDEEQDITDLILQIVYIIYRKKGKEMNNPFIRSFLDKLKEPLLPTHLANLVSYQVFCSSKKAPQYFWDTFRGG
jgi:hypothetical protein